MYVADSLFFLQHIYTDAQSDEYHGSIFRTRLRDILDDYSEGKSKPEESPEDIKNRMIEKSKTLSGTNI